ncbi:MAG: 3'-5' exoribonuclease YhaM family protein [Pirellulales bacterium]
MPIVPLCELANGQEADLFALLSRKEELQTRDGKPYFKVGFRDGLREVVFPLWGDSPFAVDCRESWTPGDCFKIRAIYRETNYGPQLDIRRIRPVTPADATDGFDPTMFLPRSRFDPAMMFAELAAMAEQWIDNPALRKLVLDLLEGNRQELLTLPGASRVHHAYVGGWLEHVLSVTRTAAFLADKYDDYYPHLQPRLNRGLVVAGAVLHDIGKLRELDEQPMGTIYTPAGELIGHILQGRDMLREAAAGRDIDAETLLRLEHIIVSHQRLPEWGSPKPPMTPEAMLVHYADDLDAKYNMVVGVYQEDTTPGPLTSKKNVLGQRFFRGEA